MYNTVERNLLNPGHMNEDVNIIRDILNGDIDSFKFLVQRYQKPVISMIKNIINDPHLCEDIAQDVFFAAFRKLKSFDSARSSFSTWLFTIAKNKSLNALKKKRILSINPIPEKADTNTPSENLQNKEFFDMLDKALYDLPVKQKVAFVLAEFENLPYQEIAQIQGVRTGTVKSRINRAKVKLAIALKGLNGDI
ncbi:MAG: sigma-70 family RNA polymerase sigma factor [Actinobacteria bacterium]|nr:sigma-70 family RNA polymerase sigma factor [Actinomycetota bacterium]